MQQRSTAVALDDALLAREAWLERASRRWSGLLFGAALAFVALLYSSPQYFWPFFEQFRLAFVSMAVGAGALAVHRVISGERLHLGLPLTFPLFAYLVFVPLSFAWTMSRRDTGLASIEAAKMVVVLVVVLNALDGPRRLRTFLLVAAIASLGPALGGVHVWRTDDALVEGFRTHWRGLYADPNRLAMSLVAVLPFALYGFATARRRGLKLLFAGVVAAQVAAIVLTHSRSGAVAAALAVALALFRGRTLSPAAKGVAFGAIAAGLLAFAPATFWERSRTIAAYDTDASVGARENAWKVLSVIVSERPLSGVGAGAFIQAWNRFAPLDAGGRRYVAHNILFEIVGDLGVLAFGLFATFVLMLLRQTWKAGADPLVGPEARAVFAGLAGYLVMEMVNGYSLSWFLYFLFACALASIRIARRRAALGRAALGPEAPAWAAR
jgi:O-antigen ligase